jgi:hypothetical protein
MACHQRVARVVRCATPSPNVRVLGLARHRCGPRRAAPEPRQTDAAIRKSALTPLQQARTVAVRAPDSGRQSGNQRCKLSKARSGATAAWQSGLADSGSQLAATDQ